MTVNGITRNDRKEENVKYERVYGAIGLECIKGIQTQIGAMKELI